MGVITYKVKKDEFIFIYIVKTFPTNTLKWTVSLFKTWALNKVKGTPYLNLTILFILYTVSYSL